MRTLALLVGLALVLVVLWDGFESVLVPRSVVRRWSLSQAFYRLAWRVWGHIAGRRDAWLAAFGPLSLMLMLMVWAVALIVGFTLLQWGVHGTIRSPEGSMALGTYLYMSGVTFFTLGFGDVIPLSTGPRIVAVAEAGIGFGFLAVVIGYLPVIYQAFSRRETAISMLDARAGSPPTAAELIQRHGTHLSADDSLTALHSLWRDWELWSAELLESHLSYPVLSFYRSQHENQSWLAALTMVLDSCALGILGLRGVRSPQAQLTFAMALHAVVDLTAALDLDPVPPPIDRLPENDVEKLRTLLRASGTPIPDGPSANERLRSLRSLYEPSVNALASHLRLTLPPWIGAADEADEWMKAGGLDLPPVRA